MIVRLLMLVVPLLLLSACAVSPNQLGISQSEWNQYSEQQRQQIKHNYRQAQEVKHEIHAKNGNSVLAVRVQGGQVLMPPYTSLQPYQAVAFNVKEGECNLKIAMVQPNNPDQKTSLKVCYANGVLYFDPSPYDPNFAKGALQFAYMPVWKRGFTYSNMSSTGFTKLTNATVFVKEIAS